MSGAGATAELPLSALTGLTAYRIVQEALTNTHKHAGHLAVARVSVDVTSSLPTATISRAGCETVHVTDINPPNSTRPGPISRAIRGVHTLAQIPARDFPSPSRIVLQFA